MLSKGITPGGREKLSKEFNLGHSELTLMPSDGQTMFLAEEKNFTEVVNMGGKIAPEN